jgi:hypothetical protein
MLGVSIVDSRLDTMAQPRTRAIKRARRRPPACEIWVTISPFHNTAFITALSRLHMCGRAPSLSRVRTQTRGVFDAGW